MKQLLATIIFIFLLMADAARSQELFKIRKDSLWGYMDIKGKLAIAITYTEAGDFSGGLAVVRNQDDKQIVINRVGKIVIHSLPFTLIGNFSENMILIETEKRFGFMNSNGEVRIEPQFISASPFSDGAAKVQILYKFGYIDHNGDVIIKAIFDKAEDFHDGLAAVEVGGLWGFIGHDGEFELPAKFYGVTHYSEGYIWFDSPVMQGFSITSVYSGLVTARSQLILSPMDKYIGRPYSDGLAAVMFNGKFGYMDHELDWIVEPQFSDAQPMVDGLAFIQLEGYGDLWGLITRSGKFVFAPEFTKVISIRYGLAGVEKEGKLMYVNKKGNIIWEEK